MLILDCVCPFAGAWQRQSEAGAAADAGPILQDSGSWAAFQHVCAVCHRGVAAAAAELGKWGQLPGGLPDARMLSGFEAGMELLLQLLTFDV